MAHSTVLQAYAWREYEAHQLRDQLRQIDADQQRSRSAVTEHLMRVGAVTCGLDSSTLVTLSLDLCEYTRTPRIQVVVSRRNEAS